MQHIEAEPTVCRSVPCISACPQCSAGLAVLKIIPGRGGCEYWTMRCTRCGGIHLDIVEQASASALNAFSYSIVALRGSTTSKPDGNSSSRLNSSRELERIA